MNKSQEHDKTPSSNKIKQKSKMSGAESDTGHMIGYK